MMKNNTLLYLTVFCLLIETYSCKNKQDANIIETKNIEMTKSGIAFKDFEDKNIKLYTITNENGLEAAFTNYGQRLVSLMIPDKNGKLEDVVLGYSTLDEYQKDIGGYYGAVIGRYGNRIAKGNFVIDGVSYDLAKNNNENHLHGGIEGFESVIWKVDSIAKNYISFNRISPDLEEGYPGNLNVSVTYTLTNENELRIEYTATTDKKTHVNLTHHSFFNLKGEGKGTVNDHLVQINSEYITAVDEGLIPTGELMPVKGTPFDFRVLKPIQMGLDQAHDQLNIGGGFDHNYVLDTSKTTTEGLHMAALVKEPISGRVMEVFTNEPGIQFYGGNFIEGETKGKNGGVYEYRGALCLETQHFPDSPNKKEFPSTLVEPGQKYNSICIYKFSVE